MPSIPTASAVRHRGRVCITDADEKAERRFSGIAKEESHGRG
jgi:hypothetical protein